MKTVALSFPIYFFFFNVFCTNNMVLWKHQHHLIIHLSHWIIINRWIVILWFCLCLPVSLFLWFFVLCMWPDTKDRIFIWSPICLLRLILSCILYGCDHGSDGGVSAFHDMCSLCKRKRGRQWGEIRFVLQLFCLLQIRETVDNCLWLYICVPCAYGHRMWVRTFMVRNAFCWNAMSFWWTYGIHAQ